MAYKEIPLYCDVGCHPPALLSFITPPDVSYQPSLSSSSLLHSPPHFPCQLPVCAITEVASAAVCLCTVIFDPYTMKTPLLLLISLTTLCTATGNEDIETRHLYAAIGSSVSFPEVKIDNDTFYDLSRANGDVIVTCHCGCKLLKPYTERGQFYQHNGTFQLNGLTKEDDGIYEHKINMTVKERIQLRIIAPVELVFSIEEVRENGSQCQVIFTCHAKGDGPLNFTLLRNDGIVRVNGTANSSSLSMDGWDPATFGMFSCNVANLASSQTSPPSKLRLPETWMQKTMRAIAVVFLLQWTFDVAYLLIEYIVKKLRRRQEGDSNDEVIQRSENPSQIVKVFAIVDNLSGFVKEICVAVTCVYEDSIPVWCLAFPGSFLFCRASFWIIYFINREKPGKLLLCAEFVCNLAMTFSNMIITPAFCIATLVIISMHYRFPCGMMEIWPIAVAIVCALLFFPYTRIKTILENKRKENTEEAKAQSTHLMDEVKVPNGDLGQPGNNNNPDSEGHGSDMVVSNRNVDQDRSEQGEVFTEGGSEDQAPKSEEGQLQVSEEVNCQRQVRSVPTPDHEDSDGTENREGRCLLTIEREVGAHDKDRVANG